MRPLHCGDSQMSDRALTDAPARPWAALSINGAVHLIPVFDLFDHEETLCWCNPNTVYCGGGKTVYHNAEDLREFDEMGH